MSWILFTLISAIIFALANIFDKYILTKLVKNPVIPTIVWGIAGLIFGIVIFIFKGFPALSYLNMLLAFISSILWITGAFLYFKALQLEEVSRVIALIYLTPLFVLILATIFLGEIFTLPKYIGILLLVLGAAIISLKNLRKFAFGNAFWLIIFANLAFAVSGIIIKYLLNFADFWTIFSYVKIGVGIATIPLFYFTYKELIAISKQNRRVLWIIFIPQLSSLGAELLSIIAVSISYVSLVSALSSVQPFFVLLFTLMLSIFHPKILEEEIGKSTLALKFFAIILIFVGGFLVI